MINRREFIGAAGVAGAGLCLGNTALAGLNPEPISEISLDTRVVYNAAGHNHQPIIRYCIFQKKPIHYGWYLDQSESLKSVYSYQERRSLVFLNEKYAGFFSPSCLNPRTWGEMIVTERHFKQKRECSSSCLCRELQNEETYVIHIDAEWTENTNWKEQIPYNWRNLPDFKDRHPCSFCGSDEVGSFVHDDDGLMGLGGLDGFKNGFYCSECQKEASKSRTKIRTEKRKLIEYVVFKTYPMCINTSSERIKYFSDKMDEYERKWRQKYIKPMDWISWKHFLWLESRDFLKSQV